MTLMVDGVAVEDYYESDTRLCWSFTFDHEVYHLVTLDEDANNLRTWVTRPGRSTRPTGWLLPEDPSRPALDEYSEETEKLIADFVRAVNGA